MNDKVYNLVMEILKSEIHRDAKTEIVKFMTLPRNTSVRPIIEMPDDEASEQLGTVNRPTAHDLARKDNPEMAQEEDSMKDILKGRI